MKCLNCGKYFSIERNLKTLFSTNRDYICKSCFKLVRIVNDFSMIPLSKYHLIIFTLFNEIKYFNYQALIYYYSKLFTKIITLYQGHLVIPYDRFYVDDNVIKEYKIMSIMEEKDIVIVCNQLVL